MIVIIVLLAAAIAALAIAWSRFPSIRQVLKRLLTQPSFVVAVVVLLTAALGLNAAVNFMQLHFKKAPVALAHPLGTITDRLGPWVQVSQDQPLDHEMQDMLGTGEYVFRTYVDERIAGSDVQQRFQQARDLVDQKVLQITEEKDPQKRAQLETERAELQLSYDRMLPTLRANSPKAVVNLSVTYYTGMVDTVAHVPDRCVTADGYEPKSYETVNWPIARELPAMQKKGDDVEVRYINFEDQTGASNITKSITYFFHVNGKFISSPLGVRRELADLFQKKGYYAKIEVMATIDNPQESAAVMTDFLTAALPQVTHCLPDWQKEQSTAAVAAK